MFNWGLTDEQQGEGGDYGPRLHLHGEAHRRIAGRIAETLRLLVPPIERRVQSSAQQACINTLNKNFTKVATAQERAVGICLRNHAKGDVSAEACIAAPNSRVEVAKRRTNAAEAKKCTAETPDFGATDADTVNNAAVRVATDVVFDIFGPEPDASLVTEAANRTFARCQQAVAREVSRCRATKIKEFNRCVKASLKAKTLQSTLDLQDCMGNDFRGRVAKICHPIDGRLATQTLPRICVAKGVGLAEAFPGCATDGSFQLAFCLDGIVECRLCLALNQTGDLERDCDLFDDGLENASCQ